MLTRGDKKENAIKRINNDRVDFSSENVGNTNYVIVNQENSLEEAADSIYQKYIAALKRIKN